MYRTGLTEEWTMYLCCRTVRLLATVPEAELPALLYLDGICQNSDAAMDNRYIIISCIIFYHISSSALTDILIQQVGAADS